MAEREAVFFTLQLTTVIIEHHKMIARLLKTQFGITYNEFSVLCLLLEGNKPLEAKVITDFLMLKKRTMRSILDELEDRSLIAKSTASADKRMMLISLTDRGGGLAKTANALIVHEVHEVFWYGLPPREFTETLFVMIGPAIEDLRGHPIDEIERNKSGSPTINVGFFLFWRLLIEYWEQAAQKRAGLGLSAARVLAIVGHFDGFSPQDIADRLLIERSGVSLYKKELMQAGLVTEEENEHDGRGRLLHCTKAGYRMAKRLDGEFLEVTHRVHRLVSDTQAVVLNAWFMRMYANLMIFKSHQNAL